MMQIKLPCEIFGKHELESRSGFHVLACSDLLKKHQSLISESFHFQWLCDPRCTDTIYPRVWFFFPLSSTEGLLVLFEDAGSDPRPHALRRTVGLCERRQCHDLLSALKSGNEPRFKLNEVDAIWEFEIDSGKESHSFAWEQGYLQCGNKSSYHLSVPARAVKDQAADTRETASLLTSKPLYLSHLAAMILGGVIALMTSSLLSSDAQESNTPPDDPARPLNLQQQYSSLISEAEDLARAYRQQIQCSKTLIDALNVFYQHSGHHLSLPQKEQLERYIHLFQNQVKKRD